MSSSAVALVTGGGRGIGRTCARALSRIGPSVAVAARSKGELERTVAFIEADGGRAIFEVADVADPADVGRMVERVEAGLGPIDLLVNNAGMFGPGERFAETDPALWWRTLEVNLRGSMLCTRAVLPGMLARGRGRVINISSGQGNRAEPMRSAYTVSKTALTRFTESLAADHSDSGVTFFALAPGPTPTALMLDARRRRIAAGEAVGADPLPAEVPDVPLEHPAIAIVLAIAAGKADGLSGRLLTAGDDLEAMIARAEDIRRRSAYVLRLNT